MPENLSAVRHADYLVAGYDLYLIDRKWSWIHRVGGQLVTFSGRFEILDDGTWKATLESSGGT